MLKARSVTTDKQLSAILARLEFGRRFIVSYSECEALFPPGVRVTEGRAAAYAFANVHGCTIDWADAERGVTFVRNGHDRGHDGGGSLG